MAVRGDGCNRAAAYDLRGVVDDDDDATGDGKFTLDTMPAGTTDEDEEDEDAVTMASSAASVAGATFSLLPLPRALGRARGVPPTLAVRALLGAAMPGHGISAEIILRARDHVST